MKIICTTEKFIDQRTSCKQEYCCNKLKWATHKTPKGAYDEMYPILTIGNYEKDMNKVFMTTHDSSHNAHREPIKFCPWCGTKIKVEHVKIDKTNEAPKPLAAPPKKKRWWQK